MTDFPLKRNLEIGEKLTQKEVEDVFGTDFGYQFKGITPRSPSEGDYIILLVNEGEIYNDEFGEGDKFIYEGEGVEEKGDQSSKYANGSLIDAVNELYPIYFFRSEDGLDEYEYCGLVEVADYNYVSDGQRMVYRFEVERLGLSSWEDFKEEERDIEEISRGSPSLTEDRTKYTNSKSRARSSVFSRRIKQLYDYSCAICNARRFSPEGNPEVESAHIYPKSEDGSDDLRNGVALCRLHHWALDAGWIAATDEGEIILNNWSERDPPESIAEVEGNMIDSPSDTDLAPHPKFFEAHRELHGFCNN